MRKLLVVFAACLYLAGCSCVSSPVAERENKRREFGITCVGMGEEFDPSDCQAPLEPSK